MLVKIALAAMTVLVRAGFVAPAMCASNTAGRERLDHKGRVCRQLQSACGCGPVLRLRGGGRRSVTLPRARSSPTSTMTSRVRMGIIPTVTSANDAYPVTELSGNPLVVNEFDFDYFRDYFIFEAGDGDGYDLYSIRNGWVSATQTRDGGGYSQTFYGSGCTRTMAGVFSDIDSVHTVAQHIWVDDCGNYMGDYWERNGQSWPGPCNAFSSFNRNTITSWEFKPQFAFGGINGAPIKYIDTIVSSMATRMIQLPHGWAYRNLLLHQAVWSGPVGGMVSDSKSAAASCGHM